MDIDYDYPDIDGLIGWVAGCGSPDTVTCPLPSEGLHVRYTPKAQRRTQVGASDWSVETVASAAVYLGDRKLAGKLLAYREDDEDLIRTTISSLETKACQLLAKEARERAERRTRRLGEAWQRLMYATAPDLGTPTDEIVEALDAGITEAAIRAQLMDAWTSVTTPWPVRRVALAFERVAERLAPQPSEDDYDPGEPPILAQLEEAAEQAAEVQGRVRDLVIQAHREGESPTILARLAGVDRTTIYRWTREPE